MLADANDTLSGSRRPRPVEQCVSAIGVGALAALLALRAPSVAVVAAGAAIGLADGALGWVGP